VPLSSAPPVPHPSTQTSNTEIKVLASGELLFPQSNENGWAPGLMPRGVREFLDQVEIKEPTRTTSSYDHPAYKTPALQYMETVSPGLLQAIITADARNMSVNESLNTNDPAKFASMMGRLVSSRYAVNDGA